MTFSRLLNYLGFNYAADVTNTVLIGT